MINSIRLLYVEDDFSDIALFNMCIERYNKTNISFTLDTANTVAEAQGMLRRSSYDIVLIDFNLPDGDGIEVIDAINLLPQKLPIILLSGLLTNEQIDKVQHFDLFGCLEKSYDAHLYNKITSILS